MNLHKCKCGCGELIHIIDKWGRQRFYLKGHDKRGKKFGRSPRYKGRIIDKSGYIKVVRLNHHSKPKNDRVFEHRIVWEEYHNVCLLSFVDIHHINGNKHDNRIENLEPIIKSKHGSHHSIERWKRDKEKNKLNPNCVYCGNTDVKKYGFSKNKKRKKLLCNSCKKVFYNDSINKGEL